MTVVYIAAPYHGESQAEIRSNIRRAEMLAAIAVRGGFAPIVIHAAIANGAYGDDRVPAERERGLQAACELAARADQLWILREWCGDVSRGCQEERDAFLFAKGAGGVIVYFTQRELEIEYWK